MALATWRAIWLAVVAAVYAIIANGAYIWLGLKGSLKLIRRFYCAPGFWYDAAGYFDFIF